ncbi:MAG: PadR family transcriptional regulator [Candidatus Omnitrophota bacterium]|jgi:PadR family transcriptional regulator PadR|nr:MAG: PadR family transcriptional regulator [Candidatus Omnitrophota bacterium]
MELQNVLTKGAVPMMIMEILRSGEAYGYEIVKEITRRSAGKLEFGQGTVYPLLYKLEEKGYVVSKRNTLPNGKERRYYRLTEKGLNELELSKKTWRETSMAISQVLGVNPAGVMACA